MARLAPWIAHALAFALVALCLKLAINTLASPFRGDLALYLGFALGLIGDVAFGLFLCLPMLWRSPLARVLTFVTCSLGLCLHAVAIHAHAVLRFLPGRESLALVSDPNALRGSLSDHASPLLMVLELAGSALVVLLWGTQIYRRAPRFLRFLAEHIRVVALSTVAWLFITPWVTFGQVHHGATNELMHVLWTSESTVTGPTATTITSQTPSSEIEQVARWTKIVQDVLAAEPPLEPNDPRFPYCREEPIGTLASHPRSIILVIMESVGAREAALEVHGKKVMPELARIAQRELSFTNIRASGDRSSQGLVALMSGIPPATHRRILVDTPLAHVPSLPRVLMRAGYHTAYVHGSDLSFEHQREYLRQRLGVETLVEPTPYEMQHRLGWGLPDGVMYERLVHVIETERTEHPDDPYFATLFTLSTHDPYAVPRNAPRLVKDEGPFEGFVNALAYSDAELGRLYDWYLEHERQRGTLLVITGDHEGRVPFPGDPIATTTGEFEYRFGVPLVIAGLAEDELSRARPLRTRVGSQLDVPQTLLALLGIEGKGCFQGRNLLASEWPKERYVASIAGEELSYFYVYDGRYRFMWALRERALRVFDEQADPLFRKDLFRADDPRLVKLSHFVGAYFALGKYLNMGDHFAPAELFPPRRSPRGIPDHSRYVAHRGNTRGAGQGAAENSLEAIDAAVRAGFEWVELEVQKTRDGVAVLSHDAELMVAEKPYEIASYDLAALRAIAGAEQLPTLREAVERANGHIGLNIELKPQKDVLAGMDLVSNVIEAIRALSPERVLVDSFSRSMLASFAALTPFEVGYDLPTKPVQREWLDYAAEAGFEWVFIERFFVTTDVLRDAHARGLKVMIYPVNETATLQSLSPERPDGVMSDVAEPWGLRAAAP